MLLIYITHVQLQCKGIEPTVITIIYFQEKAVENIEASSPVMYIQLKMRSFV